MYISNHIYHAETLITFKNDGNYSTKNRKSDHLDHNCLEPFHTPMMGTHDLSRIINVGMPKCGSTSLNQFFQDDFYSRHFHCGMKGYCGDCIKANIEDNQPPLVNCGNFTVWTQMDQTHRTCIFPQIFYLEEIYNEAPNATFILPFRNVTGWIRSVSNWKKFRQRLNNVCDFTKIGIEQKSLMIDENMEALFCNHVKHIRQFVHDHPSLTLIEVSIEDPSAGNILASHFPVDASKWGQKNANPKIN